MLEVQEHVEQGDEGYKGRTGIKDDGCAWRTRAMHRPPDLRGIYRIYSKFGPSRTLPHFTRHSFTLHQENNCRANVILAMPYQVSRI
ncbi:hypothetical protein BS17DRAFT_345743 [Gyrodon lividus]|nr:hypothetical protein BS17DRAFT_345743 [Gyrodon lividus]